MSGNNNDRERRIRAEKAIRAKLLARAQQWKLEGYDVEGLNDRINDSDIVSAKRAVIEFSEKVTKLKDLELEILLFHPEGFEDEIENLKSKLKDTANLTEVEAEFSQLKRVIDKMKGQLPEEENLPGYWELKARINKMKKAGYIVTRLEDLIDKPGGMLECSKAIDAYEKNVRLIEKIKGTIMNVLIAGLEEELSRIRELMKDPANISEIKSALVTYKMKLAQVKKEMAMAERKSKPITVQEEAPVPVPQPEMAPDGPINKGTAPEQPVMRQFRRIDLFIELIQTVFQENKRLLTLDTLRLTQRMLKRKHPKIMFFVIDKDFIINSMMPDSPESFNALNVYITHLFESLIPLIGVDDALERMRKPVVAFVKEHSTRVKASKLLEVVPDFLNPYVKYSLEFEVSDPGGEQARMERRLPSPAAVPVAVEQADIDQEKQLRKKFKVPKVRVKEVKEEEEVKLTMEIVGKTLKDWEEAGYNVEMLQRVMGQDEGLVLAVFRKMDEEIFWLREMEKDLDALERRGLGKEVEEIRKKLKDPNRSREVEDDIISLQMRLEIGE